MVLIGSHCASRGDAVHSAWLFDYKGRYSVGCNSTKNSNYTNLSPGGGEEVHLL